MFGIGQGLHNLNIFKFANPGGGEIQRKPYETSDPMFV